MVEKLDGDFGVFGDPKDKESVVPDFTLFLLGDGSIDKFPFGPPLGVGDCDDFGVEFNLIETNISDFDEFLGIEWNLN